MAAKTVAGVVFILLAVMLLNAYREGGTYAVRAWFAAKFTNKSYPRPELVRGRRVRYATGGPRRASVQHGVG